jgi:energy-coupling factor transport system permease protein
MRYRRRDTPLHSARAAAAGAYGLALMSGALLFTSPVVLGALLVAVVAAAAAARAGGELRRVLPYVAPLALTAAVLNPLFAHQGLTVLARLGDVPPFGQLDVTLESVVFGADAGLRFLVFTLAFALLTATVDPDEVLRLARRVSFRSALTASLATRMWPVLERDARRLAEAQRCRPDADSEVGERGVGRGEPDARRGRRRTRLGRRITIVRAVTTGALDRAVDVAATLELRGYAGAHRPPRLARPWSRHDLAFAAAAGALLALGVVARASGVGAFAAYPKLDLALGLPELGFAVALIGLALLPFAQRRGVAR